MSTKTKGFAARAFTRYVSAGFAAALLLVWFRGCGNSVVTQVTGPGGPGGPGCHQGQAACAVDADCCSGLCAGGVCTCGDLAAPCANDNECCSSFACTGGTCTLGCRADGAACLAGQDCCGGDCIAGVCGPPRCIQSGQPCDSTGQCCDGLWCQLPVADAGGSPHGVCEAGCNQERGPCITGAGSPACCSGYQCTFGALLCTATPRGVGLACTSDNQCSAGLDCVGGFCRQCHTQGGTCKNDGDCCAGHCAGAMCACQPMGQTCTTSADCCARLACKGGTCQCGAQDAPCASDSDCCSGGVGLSTGQNLVCTQGQCEPIGCFLDGQTCAKNSIGRGGLCCDTCGSDGVCCARDGAACDATHSCCAGDICVAGKCAACHQDGTACAANGDCCTGHCENGMCCASQGSLCGGALGGNIPCCGTFECGVQSQTCCLGGGAACTMDSDCCQALGSGCNGGHCCVTPGPYHRCLTNADCCAGSICGRTQATECCLPTGAACTPADASTLCCNGTCTGGKCP